jgi:hypothetical protein
LPILWICDIIFSSLLLVYYFDILNDSTICCTTSRKLISWKLSKPLKSRLRPLSLPEYNFDQFREIVEKLAANIYRLNREIADKIASVVWHEMGIKDVRDALWFMKLVSSDDDVEKIARIIMQYKPEILNSSPTTHSN